MENEFEWALFDYAGMNTADRTDFESRLAVRIAARNTDIWNSDDAGRQVIFRREFVATLNDKESDDGR
jgi:hypothetical protein